MDIPFETPDFTKFNKILEDKNNEELKKLVKNENNSRLKELMNKLDSCEDDFDRIELCAQINMLDSKNFIVDLVKANAFVSLGNKEKAEKAFVTAIKKSDERQFAPLTSYGLFLSNQEERREDAIRILVKARDKVTLILKDQVLEKNNETVFSIIKNSNIINYALGSLHLSLGLIKTASEFLELTYELDPDCDFDKRPLTDVRKVIQMSKEGIDECDFELRKNENNIPVLVNKIQFLIKLERIKECRECASKILLIDKNNSDAKNLISYIDNLERQHHSNFKN